MIRRPPKSTRTDTLVPYTTLFRSSLASSRAAASSNVRFTGALAPAAVPIELAHADVLVLPQAAASAERYLSPLKLFEYLAAGRAIVASDLASDRKSHV